MSDEMGRFQTCLCRGVRVQESLVRGRRHRSVCSSSADTMIPPDSPIPVKKIHEMKDIPQAWAWGMTSDSLKMFIPIPFHSKARSKVVSPVDHAGESLPSEGRQHHTITCRWCSSLIGPIPMTRLLTMKLSEPILSQTTGGRVQSQPTNPPLRPANYSG